MSPPDPYLLIVYTVAVASVTRLITTDTLFEAPRDAAVSVIVRTGIGTKNLSAWIRGRLDDRRWSTGWAAAGVTAGGLAFIRCLAWTAGKLITCPWCVSFWVACAVLAGRHYWDDPVVLCVALAMAMRMVAGILVDR